MILIEPRPLLLDLFCGAGGAAKGYHDAGFDVIGVDLRPMPHYPYEFIQGDAMEFMATEDLSRFSAFHASPPCQAYSVTIPRNPNAWTYPKLIPDVREAFQATGRPWVIENVEGAKREMIDPVTLCGSQFNLTAWWPAYGQVGLRRHRCFESNFSIPDPGPHDHSMRVVPVYGFGIPGPKSTKTGRSSRESWNKGGKGMSQAARDVMGIDWANFREVCEAIPPAYSEYVGRYLMLDLAWERELT